MSVTIKDEPESSSAETIPQSTHSHLQEPFPFCALCLRKRLPSGQFYRYNPENSATFCQVMAEILGCPFWLENFAVCRGCWSIVQLIEHFRQCCFLARNWINRHGVGMKTEQDEWLSGETLNRMESLQTIIQNQTERIGTSEEQVMVQPGYCDVSIDQTKLESPVFEEPLLASARLTTNSDEINIGTLDCSHKEIEPELDPDLKPMETEYPECLNCQEIFDTEAELQEHSKLCEVQEPDYDRKFTCPICSISFDQFKDVAVHVGSHKESENNPNCKPERYIIKNIPKKSRKQKVVFCCAICPAKFWSADELMKHTNNRHPIDDHRAKPNLNGRHVCPTCSARFVLKSALEIHQKFSHRVLKLNCPYCDQKFWKNYDLVRHLSKVHQYIIAKKAHLNKAQEPERSAKC